uniref:ribosomal protein L28 n=1 Tax=Catenella fusiformis TaxID=3024791 RepID=UPI0027DA15A1|nr:ribosomal protein L28 [Catenella fusiformis]WCH57500.1 ribosomal protein L28 [Catenella fusiformis]
MPKICKITQKKANNGYAVSHSHVRTKKRQEINLQNKRIWSNKQRKWIKIRLTTKAMKYVRKFPVLTEIC